MIPLQHMTGVLHDGVERDDILAALSAAFQADLGRAAASGRQRKGGAKKDAAKAATPLESDIILRNADEKIVVKAQLLAVTVGDKRVQFIKLQSLRGYPDSFSRAAELLEPLIRAKLSDSGLQALLAAPAAKGQAWRPDEPVRIAAHMPTEHVVRMMALDTLYRAQAHVADVIADAGVEHLHQFRVNIRKLRSLISLLKKALPATMSEPLRLRLGSIAGRTNKLRDLDVLLLSRDSYRAMLPAGFEYGLDELFGLVERQRQQEKDKVAKYLASKEFRAEMAACAAELSRPSAYETAMAAKPIIKSVHKMLLGRYHKMLASSAGIDSESEDEDIHQMRIEFKKLRYLIEFFAELLPKKRTARIVNEAKKIQAVLGDFNDCCVQIDFLNAYIDDTRVDMSKALSGLIAVLHKRRAEDRLNIPAALADFFTEHMSIEFELLFASKPSGVAP
jgi:CHAD domain-containing protein